MRGRLHECTECSNSVSLNKIRDTHSIRLNREYMEAIVTYVNDILRRKR